VMASGMTLAFQPGEARNDVVGLAFFLAAVALLLNARGAVPLGGERGGTCAPLAVAGVAAGLAAGTKLTLVAPVAALTVGIVAISAGHRVRTAGIWLAALLAGGGFWYARNVAHAGNPLPWIDSLGPISLPAPEQALQLREQFAVSHYLTDFDVWADWFFPGLEQGFGPLWPALLALAAAGATLAIVRGGDPLLRMLGAVAVVTAVAYVFTPLTASGFEGEPIGFVWNLRYLGPALALGLALVPLHPLLASGPRRSWAALAALAAAVLLADRIWDRLEAHWSGPAAVALAAAVGLVLLRLRPRPAAPALAAGLAIGAAGAIAVGFAVQRSYMDHRYRDVDRFIGAERPIAWAQGLSDARIAIGGRRGSFYQYGFYGADLTNRVQWVGREGPHGAYLPIRSCEDWRRALNRGGYGYAVTTPDGIGDPFSRTGDWTRGDPAARELFSDGPVSVFRLEGSLDPADCGTIQPTQRAG
jgi:hypothetical protein